MVDLKQLAREWTSRHDKKCTERYLSLAAGEDECDDAVCQCCKKLKGWAFVHKCVGCGEVICLDCVFA